MRKTITLYIQRTLICVVVFLCLKQLNAQTPPVIQWQKSYGGTDAEIAYAITQTADGGYTFAGFAHSNNGNVTMSHPGDDEYWVVKVNSTGTIQWQKSYGSNKGEQAYAMKQTSDGGYILVGRTNSTVNTGDITGVHGGNDMWVLKINSTGSIEWSLALGGTSSESGQSVEQTADGGYIIAGYTSSNNGDVSGNHGGNDYWLVKLTSAGTISWQKCFGGTNDDRAYSVKQSSDGGYILCGSSNTANNGNVTGNHGNNDFWVVKTDASGNLTWQKSYGGSGQEYPTAIIQTNEGGYAVVGYTNSSASGDITGSRSNYYDYWLVKLSSIGSIEWQQYYGGTNHDKATAVAQTNDGGFAIVGYVESSNGQVTGHHGGQDFWVVQTNSTGVLQWQKAMGGTGNEQANCLAIAADNSYIIAGETAYGINGDVTSNNGDHDMWVVKLGVPPCESSSSTSLIICSSQTPYNWNGVGYTASGTYTKTFVGGNSKGCDSVATLNLTVNQNPVASITASGATTICAGSSVTLTAPGIGKNNKAISLSGSQYASTTASPTISGSFTVEAWVYPTNLNSLEVFSTRQPTDNGFDFKLEGGNRIHGDIGTGSTWLTTAADATFSYSINTWYHIAYVVNSSNSTYDIYVNGNIVEQGTMDAGTALLCDALHKVSVGAYPNGGEYFNGKIDEVRVWNTARTATEIAENYNKLVSPSSTGLVINYNMDEGTGTTIADATSNHYDATYNGSWDTYPNNPIVDYDDATFLWTPGGATTKNIVVNSTGNYILTVGTTRNSCTATATKSVIVNAYPVAATISSQYGANTTAITMCSQGAVVAVYPSVANGVWSSSNPSVATPVSVSSTSSSRNVTALSNGTTNVAYTLTTPNTNCSTTTYLAVTVAQQAVPSDISGNVNLCVGSSTAYSTTSTNGVWSTTGRASINSSGIATGTSAGSTSIKYTITNASGCSASTSYNVTVFSQPTVPTIGFAIGTTGVTGSGGYCANKTFTLLGTPAGGTWSKTGVITISNAGLVNTGNTVGAFSVGYTVTNSFGCPNTRTISGSIVTCAARGTNQVYVADNQFSVYPNPARSVINLNVKTLVGKGTMVLTDLYGKQLKQQPLSIGANTIDVSNVAKGMYFISVITEQGKQTQKIIVE